MMTVDNTFALFGVISFDPGDSAGNVEFVEASPLTSVTLTFDGSPNGTVAFYDRDTTALPGSPIVTVVDPLVTQTITDPTVLAAMSTALATADTGVPAWSHLYMEAQPGVGSTGHLNITATV